MPSPPYHSLTAAKASAKHCAGARSTPAPTMPMPGSLCAMPVFKRGRIPVSATWRASSKHMSSAPLSSYARS